MTPEKIVNKIISDPLSANMEEYIKLIEDYAKDYQLNKLNQNIAIVGRGHGKTASLTKQLITIMEHFKKDDLIIIANEDVSRGHMDKIVHDEIEHNKRVFEIKNLEYMPEVYVNDLETKKVSQKEIRKDLNRNFKRKKK